MKRKRFFLSFFVRNKRIFAVAFAAALLFTYITGELYENDEVQVSKDANLRAEQDSGTADVSTQEQTLANSLHAKYAVLLDGDTGNILFGKNADSDAAMASTTKIMTCITALECETLPEVSVISPYAVSQPKVHLGAAAGTQFRTEDLLYSMMLESHNDSAAAVAENVGAAMLDRKNDKKDESDAAPVESVDSDTDREISQRYVQIFLDEMNRKAEEIGCTNTCFLTPNGLDQESDGQYHHSTAADMARILRYCIYESPAREQFLAITRTQEYAFSSLNGNSSFQCNNHNQLLQLFDEAVSGKTGFTNQAGYCYVGAVESEGRRFVVALLACGWPGNRGYKWEDVRKLISYGEENYERVNLADLKSVKAKVLVEQAKSKDETRTVCVGVESEKAKGWILKKKDAQIRMLLTLPKSVEAPVTKGQILGKMTYYANGIKVTEVNLMACDDAEKINFLWILSILTKKTAL